MKQRRSVVDSCGMLCSEQPSIVYGSFRTGTDQTAKAPPPTSSEVVFSHFPVWLLQVRTSWPCNDFLVQVARISANQFHSYRSRTYWQFRKVLLKMIRAARK
eukprot:53803-Amphidinium_carterae.1